MDGSIIQTYLADVLHAVTQSLLAPDIILLLAFIGYALFCIGSIIAESFSERRHLKVTMPKFLAALMAAKEDEIPVVIEQSGLLKRQKIALLTVYDYRMLPGDALVALIRRLVSEEETRYDRITGRNNMAARITPMLGLMGTLIPLGPGIQALGNADTAALSDSLLVAFDTTVAGLVAAAVCLVVGKIRTNWYGNYMSALDSGMATMLQKIEDMRAAGKITVKEPSDYAFLFESKGVKPAKKNGEALEAIPADKGKGKRGSHGSHGQAATAGDANARAAAAEPATRSAGASTVEAGRATADAAFAQANDSSRYARQQAAGAGQAASTAYTQTYDSSRYARQAADAGQAAATAGSQAYDSSRYARQQTADAGYARSYADATQMQRGQTAQDYSASRYTRSRTRSDAAYASSDYEQRQRTRSDADQQAAR